MLWHSTVIAFQLFLLIFSTVGWGYWVHRLTCGREPEDCSNLVVCGSAGLAAWVIFLQDLIYLDLPLKITAWIAFAIAFAGVIQVARSLIASTPNYARIGTWCVVGFAVFIFQGAGLISNGPARYYGNAHEDQVNYVQLSQFLVEKPFSTQLTDVGLHPWLVKGIDTKTARIGECVVNGYAAVVAFADAKLTYGTTTIFFITLLAISCSELLRSLGAETCLAAIGGIWVGVLPGITKTHLDGFFSQTAILFVAPTLILITLRAGKSMGRAATAAALVLAFLLSTYTEIFALGAAIFGVCCVCLTELPLRKRFVLGGISLLGALLLLFPYSRHDAWSFLSGQYGVAANPNALADLVPNSGTWKGWAEIFFTPQPSRLFDSRNVVLAALLLFMPLVGGLASRSQRRSLFLAGTVVIPLAVECLLLAKPDFPKYAFQKILVTFTPIATVLIVLGIARLPRVLQLVVNRNKYSSASLYFPLPFWQRAASTLILVALCLSSAIGSWPFESLVIHNLGILQAVNSEKVNRVYKDIAQHPERTYLIKEAHNIVNAWMCYEGRKAEIYDDSDMIGDRPVPFDQFAFRRVPRTNATLWLVTHDRAQEFMSTEGAPELIVRNPQGIDQEGNLTWYWLGDKMEFEIVGFGRKKEAYELDFHAFSGLANPAPQRTVSLIDDQTQAKQTRSFESEAHLHFLVQLSPGSNRFTLHVDSPTEWLVRIPTDLRKHMVRIQEINLTEDPSDKP